MVRHRLSILLAAALLGAALTGCDGFPALTPSPTPPVSPGTSPTEPATPDPTSPVPTSTRSPTPSGSPSSPPAEAAITINLPREGATVEVPLTASGTANTFEAALTVEVVNQAGDILCLRHIMATSGSGTRGTWEARLGFVPESTADEPATLRAYELSAENGRPIHIVERPIVIAGDHPPILLTSPVCGDSVPSGGNLAIQGLANVFEAALTMEIRDASGAAVFTRQLMTTEAGVESPFGEIVTLPALPPGFYDVVAFNISAEDGSIQNEFPVQIEVRS
ncbi:Gmad2 immunoglobulin-like domain-containing protein [Diaminobutyricimonas sp. TR449]|uniref:Gmad2 immunoglobulin-like domain-containing protein n=1 Tax=Diaminobutyricimonas sp. TR449 TaxID=2708076 RepID=UPI001423AD24|nr:Gmad2 immunoglobulin-like domain-containing protein [Diaminobutyricimonas sp. TR449]